MTNTAIRYTAEFKQTLIDLHHKGHSFKDLHEEYGPSQDTIRKWVHAATVVAIDNRTS
ncbi:helix-turn-helix domain-containing protein [Lactiplantibacillus plantarum]|uniref:helix-turn-helix domain-containing protein n=1 Tax=Lactiplantibacillus plantarum TaxID=1590 RepID=UPI0021A6C028|nr:helix-turn-helix domain-containing protein [Lactiplantibacillus plantarum]